MTRLKRRYEERRQAKVRRMTYLLLGGLVVVASVSVFFFTLAATKVNTETLSAKISSSKAHKAIKAKTASSSSQVSALVQVSTSTSESSEETLASTSEEVQDSVDTATEMTDTNTQQPVAQEATTQVYTDTTTAPVQTSQAQATTVSTTRLSNGNTAGSVGTAAAAQMAAATGVPQSTWEYIIARESNGNPNAANGSGASGLFQTMPGWGSTATVQDQVNAAIKAYNAQGLSAWGY
ncbi:transglycosylase SLT domain-containing protein [Streptococcus hyointestinalis]|uniref:transglycosylase SLT domain-containing protein n=1 Tax=Streptococcus hyointestinalis TaxID=1337 RepID=UPI00197F8417|nr:transglycosylase SLT domain-containing protein [Streptococcus hyointestinalis]